jgi:stage II sporulation protein D
MRRTVFLTALCACLAAPAQAPAASWVVKGAGFGHGVGMSQYGAYGYAQHGFGHREILAHYYTGTEIGKAGKSRIRVLLQSGRRSVSFSGVDSAGTKRLNAATTYVARPRGAKVVLKTRRGRRAGTFSGVLRLKGPRGFVRLGGTALNGVSGGSYRGAIELRAGGGRVTAVNLAGLDAYLQGVVPGEMPASWAAEALQAQAVAARTYALGTDAGGAVFDQYPDTRSQVYKGMSAEQPSTNAAVRATSGEVVTYQGALATTYYFSTSGGQTENVENVFYGSPPIPYLRSVKDPYDGGSPRHRWRLRFTGAQMRARLGSLCRGSFRAIKVRKRGVSPRVVLADVVCSRATVRTSGTTLRARLGLYDTWFTVKRASAPASKQGVGAKLFRAAVRAVSH